MNGNIPLNPVSKNNCPPYFRFFFKCLSCVTLYVILYISFVMVDVRVLLDSVNGLFYAITWEMTYLYEKYASARLSIPEEKSSSSSSAWF